MFRLLSLKSVARGVAAAALFVLAGGPAQSQSSSAQAVTVTPPNTTGPIDRPLVSVIAKNTYFINEFGADSIYLLVGSQRALVIDTGSGFCDLKAIISGLTTLPYDVAITHGHPDHAGGAGQFDVVYMDPADIPMAKKITYEGEVRYGRIMRGMTAAQLGHPLGFPNVWAYSDSNVRKWDKFPEVKPLHDGMVFDLGGRHVTVYHIGNHTPGSSIFLDDESRIIFTGDVANFNVGANDAVSSVIRGLLKIKALSKEFDRIYTGHTAYANLIEPYPEDPEVLDDLIENFRSILRGNPHLEVIPNHLFPERKMTVAVYKKAKNTFHPDKLWEPGEPHVIP